MRYGSQSPICLSLTVAERPLMGAATSAEFSRIGFCPNNPRPWMLHLSIALLTNIVLSIGRCRRGSLNPPGGNPPIWIRIRLDQAQRSAFLLVLLRALRNKYSDGLLTGRGIRMILLRKPITASGSTHLRTRDECLIKIHFCFLNNHYQYWYTNTTLGQMGWMGGLSRGKPSPIARTLSDRDLTLSFQR